jgi:hypothetical protein
MVNQNKLVERATKVKRRHEAELLSHNGVTSVGVGFRKRGGKMTDTVCIVVMVKNKLSHNRLPNGDQLPTELEGIAVDVQESGDIIAR